MGKVIDISEDAKPLDIPAEAGKITQGKVPGLVVFKEFNNAEDVINAMQLSLEPFTVINSAEDKIIAQALLEQAKTVITAIDKRVKDLIQPHNTAIADIKAFGKKFSDQINPLIQEVKNGLLDFHKWEERKAMQLRTDARIKALKSLGFKLQPDGKDYWCPIINANMTLERVETYADGLFNLSFEGWAVKIKKIRDAEKAILLGEDLETVQQAAPAVTVDVVEMPTLKGKTINWTYAVEDESLIPDKYWKVDTAAITAAVKGGERVIPGVRIFSEDLLKVANK